MKDAKNTPAPRRTLPLILLAVITLAAAQLRIYQVHESLWIDELHTAWTVSAGIDDVAPRAAIGNQSPLYFYLIWAMTQVLGMTELAVRLPSLLAGTLLVPLAYLAVIRWTKSATAGLLVAVLVALERDFLFYSIEARPYALVQLVGLSQVMLFVQLLCAPPRADSAFYKPTWLRAAFVAASALLCYLHYTAALLIVGEVLAYGVLLLARRRAGYDWCSYLVDLAVVGLFCKPAVAHLLQISERRGNWSEMKPDVVQLWRYGTIYLLLPLTLWGLALFTRIVTRRQPSFRSVDARTAIVVAGWAVVPCTVAGLLAATDFAQLAMYRYVIVSAIGTMVAAACFLAACASRAARGAFAAVMIAAALLSNDAFYFDGQVLPHYRASGRLILDRNEDWSGLVSDLNSATDGHDHPVFVCPGLVEDPGLMYSDGNDELHEYCLFPVTGIYPIKRDRFAVTFKPNRFNRKHLDAMLDAGGAWLIVRGPGLADHVVNEALYRLASEGTFPHVDAEIAYGNLRLIWVTIEPL